MSESKPKSSNNLIPNNDLIKIIINELRSMISFSLSTGKSVGPSYILNLKSIDELDSLNDITDAQIRKASIHHNSMSKLIYPALPQNVLYLDQQNTKYEARKKGSFEPKFPIIRKLIIFGIISVAGLIICGYSELVNIHSMDHNVLSSNGFPFLLNLFFLSCASAIGATFMLLSTVKSKFSSGLYHPDMDSGYWITVVLGIIGGIIITELIPISSTGTEDGMLDDKLLLALLSGFSSQLVYNVLNKLINAVESLINGGAEVSRANEIQRMKIVNEYDSAKTKVDIANKMNSLRKKLKDAPNNEDTNSTIDEAIDGVMEDMDTAM